MAFQAAITFAGLLSGLEDPTTMPRPVFVLIQTAAGFGLGLAFTVAWVLVYELFRHTLPRLVSGGLQKVRRRHPV